VLPEKPHGLFSVALHRKEQRPEKTRTETSTGTRWIIGGLAGSVKPGKREFPACAQDLELAAASKRPLMVSGPRSLLVESGL